MRYVVIDAWQDQLEIEHFNTENEANDACEMLNTVWFMNWGIPVHSVYGRPYPFRFWVDALPDIPRGPPPLIRAKR